MQGWPPLGLIAVCFTTASAYVVSARRELTERGASLPGGLSAQHTVGATRVMGDGQASRRTVTVSRMRPLLGLQNEWVWLSDVSSVTTPRELVL